MKVVTYARYSSDKQSESSIIDQQRNCEHHASPSSIVRRQSSTSADFKRDFSSLRLRFPHFSPCFSVSRLRWNCWSVS